MSDFLPILIHYGSLKNRWKWSFYPTRAVELRKQFRATTQIAQPVSSIWVNEILIRESSRKKGAFREMFLWGDEKQAITTILVASLICAALGFWRCHRKKFILVSCKQEGKRVFFAFFGRSAFCHFSFLRKMRARGPHHQALPAEEMTHTGVTCSRT